MSLHHTPWAADPGPGSWRRGAADSMLRAPTGRHGKDVMEFPEAVWDDPALTTTDRMVYATLRRHTESTGALTIDREAICENLSCAPRTVSYSYERLEDRGHIRFRRNHKRQPIGVEFLRESQVAGQVAPQVAGQVAGQIAGQIACQVAGQVAAAPSPNAHANISASLREALVVETREKATTISPLPPAKTGQREREAGEEMDRVQAVFNVEVERNPNPDPAYSPEALMTRWTQGGLPLAFSTAPLVHLEAFRRLHHEAPFWGRQQVEEAVDKLIEDARGARQMSWAWKQGPVYLVKRKSAEDRQGIEKVLCWEGDRPALNGRGRASPKREQDMTHQERVAWFEEQDRIRQEKERQRQKRKKADAGSRR